MLEASPVVFVVDDDLSVRRALARLIRSVGLRVETFASADEFLEADQLTAPGCVILDVRMPGMTGPELQRRLTAVGSPLPIIYITAHDDEATRTEAMEAGASAFFEKPFDDEALLDAVYAALVKGPLNPENGGAP